MNNRHKRFLAGLYQYIERLVKNAINNDKQFIIWGYARGGAFIKYLLENEDARAQVAYIIDDKMDIVINGTPKIYRSTVFDYIDNSKYILLSTILDFEAVEKRVSEYGYVKGVNLFNTRKDIGVSYVDYLQLNNNCGLDFSNTTQLDYPEIYTETDNYISTPFDTISVDKVFERVSLLEEEVYFFDYGCGKGQILFDAYINGINHLSGIELVPSIAHQAWNNLEELGISADIYEGNAMDFTEIDQYNVFYFFNPFGGNVFRKVINNIENSIKNNPRRVHIIYMNPTCHKMVIENSVFRLDKQLYVACGDPLANFYVAD